MKVRRTNVFVASIFAATLWGAAGLAGETVDTREEAEVALEKTSCGCECVMVFAKVGEEFQYDFETESGQSLIVPGMNASGEMSRPPQGLRLDAGDAELSGIPLRPGFHEFVVLQTEKGVTHEKVVLIDVQGHSFAAGGLDYASYFAGGIQ